MDSALFTRFEVALAALDAHPDVTVTRAIVERSSRVEDGESMRVERELARTVGLVLDDSLCATYDQVARVDVRWNVRGGQHGSLYVPDYFTLEDAFVQPAEHGATGALADFLTELHLIECLDALHWTAFRTPGFSRGEIDAEPMELWTRIPAANERTGIDLELDATWDDYLERMLVARGAEQFALTLVPDDRVAVIERKTFAYFLGRFCDAAAHFRDARLDELIDDSRRRVARWQ